MSHEQAEGKASSKGNIYSIDAVRRSHIFHLKGTNVIVGVVAAMQDD